MKQVSQKSGNARAGRIAIDDELRKQVRGKQDELRNAVDYIPLEGSVDEQTYIIGPGDQFLISFAGSMEEKYVVPVGADGYAILPYTSSVRVSDIALAEAKVVIRTQLTKIYCEEDISVTLASARLFLVHVTGMVAIPGAYAVTAADRVHSAIEIAGGALSTSELSNVKIFRNGDTISTDISDYLSSGNIDSNPTLFDGDIVFVPSFDYAAPWIYLSDGSMTEGAVNTIGNEDLRGFITRIGADRQRIDRSNITLIRQGEEYRVDLLSSSETVPLGTGDSLFMHLLPDSVYVGGRVNQGGSVPYIAGNDGRAYVAMAGGVAKEGTISKIRIYRNGERISASKAGTIQPGDVIIVGTDGFYIMTEFLKTLGQIGTFASAIYVIGFRD